LLSTRIIVTQSRDRNGQIRIIGLLAENATDVVRKQARDFQETGLPQSANSYLGPVTMDARGPVQWLHEDRLLSEPIQRLLDNSPPAIPA
jgi:chemotaxis-related protein WspB